MTSAEDAEIVLRAIPQDESEALAAMVRVMRVLVYAEEGLYSEEDLFALYTRERARAEAALAAARQLREPAERFVAAYLGNKAGTLGNGAARQALEEFRVVLADVPPPGGAP
jgi:predicted dinucleotide-binding enzyme